MLSGRFWTEAAIFLGVSAMEGQFLQVGPHRAPSASGARGVGDLRRTGLALIERCAQPFDRYRTIGQPTIAKQVCERLGDREDRNIDSGNCVAFDALVEILLGEPGAADRRNGRHRLTVPCPTPYPGSPRHL